MGKLHEEFLNLKEKSEFKKLDITDRLETMISDDTRSYFNSSTRDQLYSDLIPDNSLKSTRDRDIITLFERKIYALKEADKDNKGQDDRAALQLLTKIMRRKLVVDDLSSKIALTGAEMLALAAIIAKQPNKKKLFKQKAMNLLGIGSVSVSEMEELRDAEQEVFNISEFVNERLAVKVPEQYINNELAKILTKKLELILSKKSDSEITKGLEKVSTKIQGVIEGEDPVDEEDFSVLHHFQNLIFSKLDQLENGEG